MTPLDGLVSFLLRLQEEGLEVISVIYGGREGEVQITVGRGLLSAHSRFSAVHLMDANQWAGIIWRFDAKMALQASQRSVSQ